MRLLLILAAVACAAGLPMGGAASACVMMLDDGPPVSERERVARERRRSHETVERRLQLARAALAGGADPASALAEMVVPNVRPVWSLISSCGPLDEIDQGPGAETPRDWLAGTPYQGRLDEFSTALEDVEGELPGRACNAEFRGRFAAHLRRRLPPRRLRAAYLFLGARWPTIEPGALRVRLTAFRSLYERRPPLHWGGADRWQQAQISRWLRRDPDARALQRAMDEFWQETAPLLGTFERTCPAAAAAWAATQARIVAAVRAEEARRAAIAAAPADEN